MVQQLRIAVADDDREMREYLDQVLPRLGHKVVALADNGRALVDAVLRQKPDLVITDIKMPDMDGLQAAEAIYNAHPVPIIVVSALHDSESIARAESDHVMAYLVKPITLDDLEPAIVLANRRFGQFRAVQREAEGLREALADRKLIERAKGIVMKRANLDEESAFRRLQQISSRQNTRMVDLARSVVTAEGVFN